VSVRTDTSAQLSTNGNLPLTDREHKCVNRASMGLCKTHCISEKQSPKIVATTKSSWGSREATNA
jgi:hypothetical protein